MLVDREREYSFSRYLHCLIKLNTSPLSLVLLEFATRKSHLLQIIFFTECFIWGRFTTIEGSKFAKTPEKGWHFQTMTIFYAQKDIRDGESRCSDLINFCFYFIFNCFFLIPKRDFSFQHWLQAARKHWILCSVYISKFAYKPRNFRQKAPFTRILLPLGISTYGYPNMLVKTIPAWIIKMTISSIVIGLKKLLFSTNSLAKLQVSDNLLSNSLISQSHSKL